jgi:hypothetical protein
VCNRVKRTQLNSNQGIKESRNQGIKESRNQGIKESKNQRIKESLQFPFCFVFTNTHHCFDDHT